MRMETIPKNGGDGYQRATVIGMEILGLFYVVLGFEPLNAITIEVAALTLATLTTGDSDE